MDGTFFLDIIIGESSTVVKLLSGEYQTLLVRRDPLLLLDFHFYVFDSVGGLNVQSDGFTCQCLDEDLHVKNVVYFCYDQTQKMKVGTKELTEYFQSHIVKSGFREEVAREICSGFPTSPRVRYPQEFRWGECYTYLLEWCRNREGQIIDQENLIDVCYEFGLRRELAEMYVTNGLFLNCKSMEAHVTMYFLKSAYPGDVALPIKKPLTS